MGTGWIKFEARMLDNPQVFAVGRELDKDPDIALVAMLRLWCWLDTHGIVENPAGGFSVMMIDQVAQMIGFSIALERVGIVVRHEKGCCWFAEDFFGCTLEVTKRRALGAERQARRRMGIAGSALPCAALLRKMDAGKGKRHAKQNANTVRGSHGRTA